MELLVEARFYMCEQLQEIVLAKLSDWEWGSILGGPSFSVVEPSFSVVDLSDCFLKPMRPLFSAHQSLASLMESENNHKITQPSENSKS